MPKNLAWRILGPVALMASTGCAAAYHDYSDGCVPYTYTPQPPLPYTTYADCLTPIASQILERDEKLPEAESL